MRTGNLLLLSATLCSLLVTGMSAATGPRGKISILHCRQLHSYATSVPPNSLFLLLKQTGIVSCPHFLKLRCESHLSLKDHLPGTKCHYIETVS